MEFFRQEYWSGQPFPPPGDLPNLGIEPVLQADSLRSEPPGKPQQKTAYTTNDNIWRPPNVQDSTQLLKGMR